MNDQILNSSTKKISKSANQKTDALTSASKGKSMLLKTLVLGACLSTLSLSAIAGAGSGGGGGAYKLSNGKLVTLPEFGVLIEDQTSTIETTGKRYEEYYIISEETKEEVRRIEKKLNEAVIGLGIPGDSIPAYRATLVKRFNVDPAEYARIKEEYKAVLSAFDYKLDEEKFVLPAVSVGSTTYIFPDFDKLTPQQQAKYLIHEAGMRTWREETPWERVEKLERILKFDTIIQTILTTKKKKIDLFGLLQRLRKIGYITQENVLEHIFQMLNEDLGRPVTLDELGYFRGRFDPSLIQELQMLNKLERNYAEMLDGTVIELSYYSSKTELGLCTKGLGNGGMLVLEKPGMFFHKKCKPSFSFGVQRWVEYNNIRVRKAGPFLQKFDK